MISATVKKKRRFPSSFLALFSLALLLFLFALFFRSLLSSLALSLLSPRRSDVDLRAAWKDTNSPLKRRLESRTRWRIGEALETPL